MNKWGGLFVLSAAQFLMVLDQAVMNVAITQLTLDFNTSVTVIQGVITIYALTMAMLMLTGGKVGDIVGRRRAFTVGLIIYGAGSALTAASWNVGSLLLGWSILEGIGAALVLPALVALVASTYADKDRVVAFAVLGGVAGAGIAVGPIIGGFFTTHLSWRLVFVGEVVIALAIVVFVRLIKDAKVDHKPKLDYVGSLLSGLGLGMIVITFLMAPTWGWVVPKNSPIEPLGFSLTPFVIAGGFIVLWLFARWEDRRERLGLDPLVKMALFKIGALRDSLASFLTQNVILLGIFFVLPLYFQIVLGLDALETGIKMLPISIAMFVTSLSGAALVRRFSPKRIVQAGFGILAVAAFAILAFIQPELDSLGFSLALAVLGIGVGLGASQLGNIVASSVGAQDRSEAGGLQNAAMNLGSAIGTALIGAVVVGSLVSAFIGNVQTNDAVPSDLTNEIEISVTAEASFVSANHIDTALRDAGVDEATTTKIVADFKDAQLDALRAGLLIVAFIALGSLLFTRRLPDKVPVDEDLGTPDSDARSVDSEKPVPM